jgi:hypothetical protein
MAMARILFVIFLQLVSHSSMGKENVLFVSVRGGGVLGTVICPL